VRSSRASNRVTPRGADAALIVAIAFAAIRGQAQEPRCDEDLVFPPDALVEGQPIASWAAGYWKWVARIETSRNPMLDPSGSTCAIEQSDPVFYLPGTLGGSTDPVLRTECVVPANVPILVPLVPLIAWAPGDCELDDPSVCRNFGEAFTASVRALRLAIDGREIRCLEDHRQVSEPFSFTVPAENLFGIPEPFTRTGFADGYFAMIRPLAPGAHVIEFHIEHASFPTERIRYELNVVPEPCRDDRVYEPGALVEGKTVGEWLAEWWKWVLAIPTARNPLLDETGENCADAQDWPVFFLAGTVGGSTEPIVRTRCPVPCGKPLLLPIVNVVAWGPGDCAQEDMAACERLADEILDAVTGLVAEVDGRAIPCAEDFRVVSPVFEFTVPPAPDNIYGLEEPFTRLGVGDGYMILIEPLDPGPHTIRLHATLPGFTLSPVIYEFTVAECPDPASFRRGDVDGTGQVNITDAVAVLQRLFQGGARPSCEDAADTNDDGGINVSDPVYLLNHLFLSGPVLPAPGTASCGVDSTRDDPLGCEKGC
jgi:hypothetical protein